MKLAPSSLSCVCLFYYVKGLVLDTMVKVRDAMMEYTSCPVPSAMAQMLSNGQNAAENSFKTS